MIWRPQASLVFTRLPLALLLALNLSHFVTLKLFFIFQDQFCSLLLRLQLSAHGLRKWRQLFLLISAFFSMMWLDFTGLLAFVTLPLLLTKKLADISGYKFLWHVLYTIIINPLLPEFFVRSFSRHSLRQALFVYRLI